MAAEYVFVDEWDVAAPPEAVFDAIADARSYPLWWSPVYIDVESDGPPELGKESRQHFKGRLPYHVRTRSVISELEPPHTIAADAQGNVYVGDRGNWRIQVFDGDGKFLREIAIGVIIIGFLMFEPDGLAHRWRQVKAYWKLYPFSH